MKIIISCETPKDIQTKDVIEHEKEIKEDLKLELEDYGMVNVDVQLVK